MAEKKEVVSNNKKKRAKGNFGVLVQHAGDDADAYAGKKFWEVVQDGLESTVACERHIKENAESFSGKTLMIAQIKKVGEIQVETKVKVTF